MFYIHIDNLKSYNISIVLYYFEKDITLYRCTKYCKIYFKPYYFVGNSLSCVKKCKKIKKGFSKNRKMDILKMSKIDS